MVVVGAIIKNQANEYLLQLRDDKVQLFKNCWTLFGGIVEANETPEQAILRELQEELVLTSEHIKSLKQVQDIMQNKDTRLIVFELETDATLDKLTLTEGKDMQFFTEDTIFHRNFAFNIEQILHLYLKRPTANI
jgi:mutator protein MutT